MGNVHLSPDKVPPEVYRRLVRLLVKKTSTTMERPVMGDAGKLKKAAQ